MKITQQLLEEMVKEELNEGKIKDTLAAIALFATLGNLGYGTIQFMGAMEDRFIEDSVKELQQMDEEEVRRLQDESKKIRGNEVVEKIWTQYEAEKNQPPAEPLPENRSRLERIIAEELEKVLKA